MLPILPYFLEKDPQSLVNHATAKLIQISRKSHEVPQGRVKNYANISGDKKLVNNENKTFVIPDPFDLLTGLSEASPSSTTSFEVRIINTVFENQQKCLKCYLNFHAKNGQIEPNVDLKFYIFTSNWFGHKRCSLIDVTISRDFFHVFNFRKMRNKS